MLEVFQNQQGIPWAGRRGLGGRVGYVSETHPGRGSRANHAGFSRCDEGFGFYSECDGATGELCAEER